MIRLRPPERIHQAQGFIQNGNFTGRWHFSFDDDRDPEYVHFESLRVLNDDTLSPGAVWPLHRHRHIEVVTEPGLEVSAAKTAELLLVEVDLS